MKRFVIALITATLLLPACSSQSEAIMTSAEYVPDFSSSGVTYKFEGQEIIRIQLDFAFNDDLVPGVDPASDNYREELYSRFVTGAHFYHDNQEVESVWGYWPSEATASSATKMSLFYLVPADHSVDDLRFTFDSDVLGEGASGIDTSLNPQRK